MKIRAKRRFIFQHPTEPMLQWTSLPDEKKDQYAPDWIKDTPTFAGASGLDLIKVLEDVVETAKEAEVQALEQEVIALHQGVNPPENLKALEEMLEAVVKKGDPDELEFLHYFATNHPDILGALANDASKTEEKQEVPPPDPGHELQEPLLQIPEHTESKTEEEALVSEKESDLVSDLSEKELDPVGRTLPQVEEVPLEELGKPLD